ncbi:MAG: hypothetical protein ACFFDW_11710 [Candidatus Thorarchaeota archaeon]
MMSLALLFWDELRGFIKSKVMFALWIGMPLIAILMHFIQPDADGLPVTILTGLLVASIGGLLAAVMLSTTIVNELNSKVYDLYLIRPVKRANILLAKYFAVFLSLTIAAFLSFAIGLLIDIFTIGLPPNVIIIDTLESLSISLAAMSISCAAGIFIGILVKSVPLAAILSIYLGEQLSVVAVLPGIFLTEINPLIFSISIGVGLTLIIILAEILVFRKKQF